MVDQGKRGARAVKSLKEDPHRLLVTILVGNNMVNIPWTAVPFSPQSEILPYVA